MEKIDNLCIEGPMGWAVLGKLMPANWPNMGLSIFLTILNLKYKIIVGVSTINKVCFEIFKRELLHIRRVEVAKIPANPVPVLK